MIKRRAMVWTIPVMAHLGAEAVHADGSSNLIHMPDIEKIQGPLPPPIKRCELGVVAWSAG